MPQQTGRKILIYFPEGEDIEALFDKAVAVLKTKEHNFRPYGKSEYTMSAVMLAALKELEKQYDESEKIKN